MTAYQLTHWTRYGLALGLIGALCLFNAAHAEVQWSGSLALTSDYLQQGLSQTRGAAALQGGLRAQLDENWTLGVWGSSIDRNAGPGATLEVDLYAARAWRITPEWLAAVTATHYLYPNDTGYLRYDYDEVAASLGYRSTVFATVAWSPNYSAASYSGAAVEKSAVSYEVTANQPFTRGWSASLGAGYRDLSELFDESYWYGHAGLMNSHGPLTLHLTYTYVDRTARQLFGDERAAITWSAAAIWRFGDVD
jgi:uncharacterized protein (TIGR02001 family)